MPLILYNSSMRGEGWKRKGREGEKKQPSIFWSIERERTGGKRELIMPNK